MPKLYIAFHDNGVVRDIAAEALEGYLPAPSKATSTLALRYALQEGKAIDRFPGKSDEAVLAVILAEQAAQLPAAPVPQKVITQLAFMNRFTLEELAAIYTAAKTDVMVEVFLDKLKLAEAVNLNDAQTIAGLQILAASGLLTEARGQAVLQS
ncbi:hypothetical protein FJY94_08415 [Candidatus Kaiserbacteria bacterium]|nr:hypothetical protein [Candidatus Kaiserbacteria bacterium]